MNDKRKNIEFQITFCETNLRYLAGEPPSEEVTRKQKFMVDEIDRLKKELGTLNA